MSCKFCSGEDDFRLIISGVQYSGGSANLWRCNVCKNIAAFRLPVEEEEQKRDKEFWDSLSYYDYKEVI